MPKSDRVGYDVQVIGIGKETSREVSITGSESIYTSEYLAKEY